MMNVIEKKQILVQASDELSVLINAYNARLKKQIQSTDMDEPDYMDFQTCHELLIIANELKG